MSHESASDRVWHDICAAYERPAIATLAAELEQRFGVDVPLLLFLAVVEGEGSAPDAAGLAEFIAAAAPWREQVIQPLRAVRKAMKHRFAAPDEMALRDRVKQIELDAERQHVRRLAGAWRPAVQPVASAIAVYLGGCGVPPDEIGRALESLGHAPASRHPAAIG